MSVCIDAARQPRFGRFRPQRSTDSLGPVAQRLEQGTHNPLVGGSNPSGPTRLTTIGKTQNSTNTQQVDSVPDSAPEIYTRIFDELPQIVWEYTVPILVFHEHALRPHATGTLFQFGDHRLLVSAAHVLLDAHENGAELFIVAGKDRIVPLSGDAWFSSRNTFDDYGSFDLAVWNLREPAASALSDCKFARRTNISFEDDLTSGIYFVMGFPVEWGYVTMPTQEQLGTMHLNAISYVTHPFDGSTTSMRNFNDRHNVLFHIDRSQIFDVTGNDCSFPQSVVGISGCSVWKTFGDAMQPEKWNAYDARIVAVQTSVYAKSGALKATRWGGVATVIHKAFPELRRVLDIALPH